MKAFEILGGQGRASLKAVERRDPQPAAGEVLLRVTATALNYRDLMIAGGLYPALSPEPVIPLSDGVGEVLAVGTGVTRFKAGDRVMPTFFPGWQDGRIRAESVVATLGADSDGMLAEFACIDEKALVAAPSSLSDAQAATLPCAGVTAWNALYVTANLKPGDSVLLLGTGGVSNWALQLARATGLRAIVTSSSDAKLERARALGASATVNYRQTPDWDKAVLDLTGGAGVDAVLEVGGEGTLQKSLNATAAGGTVAVIGGVAGFGGTPLAPFSLIGGAKRIAGIFVGSRRMLEDLSVLVELAGIQPVVDRSFDFDQAPEAYACLESGQHFGKVVIAGAK